MTLIRKIQIANFVNRYAEENNMRIRTYCFSDGDEITDNYQTIYDLILLDIQMARLDGMKTAEYIRTLDEDVIIVFITNLFDFALRGYSVNAMDFVLKPVSYFSISQQIKKSEDLMKKRKQPYISIQQAKDCFV
jgi:DNA-binding LytR/AlgR family response regulator